MQCHGEASRTILTLASTIHSRWASPTLTCTKDEEVTQCRDNGGRSHKIISLKETHTGGGTVFDDPRPFQGDGEEKPECGDGNNDLGGREASLLRQINQIRPDVGWPERSGDWRIGSEPTTWRRTRAACSVSGCGSAYIDHSTAKRAH